MRLTMRTVVPLTVTCGSSSVTPDFVVQMTSWFGFEDCIACNFDVERVGI
jgi:hypothetical protein